ncbi:thioredoxin H4-1 [Typha angustifolia]|uniref:thioredoxin H4-1 n=1 Tax=Typha angustifolia TaxID=59011 RepID=UPI003C2E444D
MGNCFGRSTIVCEEKLDYSGGNVHVITDKKSYDEEIAQANEEGKIVVVNFSASWCAPCKVSAPLYAALSTRHTSLVFLAIDVDELAELSSLWNIRATPSFLFLKDGKKLDMLEGSNKVELEKKMVFFVDSLACQPQRIQDDAP